MSEGLPKTRFPGEDPEDYARTVIAFDLQFGLSEKQIQEKLAILGLKQARIKELIRSIKQAI